MISADIVGFNSLMNKALWKQIWRWVPLLSRMKKSTSTNPFLKLKKFEFWKIIQFPESQMILLLLKPWLKSLMLNAKLPKIQFMNLLLILKKESLTLYCFTWEEYMLLIIGHQLPSKIKELWPWKLDLFSWELKLTTQKCKEFKLSLKRSKKSLITSWLFQVQLLTISVFWELKFKNTFVKQKNSKKMKPKMHLNAHYVTKNSVHVNFWQNISSLSILRLKIR